MRSYLDFRGRRYHRLYNADHAQHTGGRLVSEPRAARTKVELPPPGAAGRVLLVDDDFGILDGLSDFLENEVRRQDDAEPGQRTHVRREVRRSDIGRRHAIRCNQLNLGTCSSRDLGT